MNSEPTYGKEVAERLFALTSSSELLELRAEGIFMPQRIANDVANFADWICWNPQSALLQSDPQQGKFLPIPFSGRELAAFLVCPVAQEFIDRFGAPGALNGQALADYFGGVRDGMCRRAVEDAYAHLKRASDLVGPQSSELSDQAAELSSAYEQTRDLAMERLGIASASGHGLTDAEYRKRNVEVNEEVRELKDAVTAAHALNVAEKQDWPSRMTMALFDLPNGGRDDAATNPGGSPAVGSANHAPACDFAMLASREQLIGAFGNFTGMDATWFRNLKDAPALRAARKVTGQGRRGHTEVPWFCPFEVMQWLVSPNRRKGRKLGAEKAWELLERNFPRVYSVRSVGDPRDCD